MQHLQQLGGRKQRKIPKGSINRVGDDTWRVVRKFARMAGQGPLGLVDPAVSGRQLGDGCGPRVIK